jgi:hypothetical protein
MANKRGWDSQQEKKRLEYLFRAYVLMGEEAWFVRYDMLARLAQACGDCFSWSETIHVGPTLDRQDWAIYGFKEYEQKLKFEAGLPAVMALAIELPPGHPLPNGLADPNRDLSGLAQRMANKPYRGQWR